ncbi:MAG: AAA family ATPase, partial [Prevotellaceae bacterium]|nr:AAA family ATPase [Prevotellaceae bacterium]
MNEFLRNIAPNNLFEGITDEPVEIVLKFKDDYATTWERNQGNTLKFEQVKRLLNSEKRISFFQKNKKNEQKNEFSHKIIVPIEDDKSIELIVAFSESKMDRFTVYYSYFVIKAKESVYINEPKDSLKRSCSFRIISNNDKDGTNSSAFIQLYNEIDALNIPTVDINKEKDKQIWKTYVGALKELVKQKVQVWKIQKIDKPVVDNVNNSSERKNFIDIYIDEKDLSKQFGAEIEDYFNVDELEDCVVSEERAFIEFNTYRELSQEEREKIINLAAEYFYDISNDSPTHYISGEFNFKYIDDTSKDEILSQLKDILSDEYQIEINIDDKGYLDISESEYPHIQKVVNDNFDFILELKQDNNISLKVEVGKREMTTQSLDEINTKLQSKGLTKARVSILDGRQQIAIDVSANIFPDFLKEIGLSQKERICRFGNFNNKYSYIEIDGISLVDNVYQLTNITSKSDSQKILERIQKANEDLSIRLLPTRYIFELSQKRDINKLREFKTQTDIQGRTNFDIAKSILTVIANDTTEYDANIERVKRLFPNSILENKAYQPTFFLKFKTDLENQRKEIFIAIQNEIRKMNIGRMKFDPYKHFSRATFEYNFDTEEKRDKFKQIINSVCEPYKKLLNYSFENELGRTFFEFYKNEKLEFENEKKVFRDIKSETFVYITREQKSILDIDNVKIDSFDKEGIFELDDEERQDFFDNRETQKQKMIEQRVNKREIQRTIDYTQQIGTLVKKQGNKFTFKLSDKFYDHINEIEDRRLNLRDLIGGCIKPIFPGELTNIDRMIKAMSKVTEPGKVVYKKDNKTILYKVGYPANKNLPNFLFDPNTARQSTEDIEEEKKRILSNLNEPLLKNQPKQLEAVAKSLLAKDVALIQGPPGTGKTTVIAEIIWQTLLREPDAKILITSQTNLAVDNALERLKGKKLVRPIRIGNIEKFEDEGKVYANERLKQWLAAKPNSNEEIINSDNAICEWIKNVSKKCSDNEAYPKAITKWKNGLTEKDSLIKTTFSAEYFKFVNVFAATCSECGSRNFGEAFQQMFQKNKETQGEPEFDLVIMDEASKATPPELVLPLTLGKKVIIIGDHKQLPPMIDEQEFSEALGAVGAKQLVEDWTKDDYKISQFEKLFVNAPKNFVASLDTQFRMHGQIMNCISQFYKDQEELEHGLICGIKGEMNIEDLSVKASRWHGFNAPPF